MRYALLVAILCFCLCPAKAGVLTIDFEGLGDFNPITTEYTGLVFSNTASIVSGDAGGSLNQTEFPPRSGITVAFNSGIPMSIAFTVPVLNFEGFFNYNAPVTLEAFNASHGLVGSVQSAFGNNLGVTGELGSATNEPIALSFAGGFSSVEISIGDFTDPFSGSTFPGSFTLDDLTITTSDTSNPGEVPEASSISLVVGGAGLVFLFRRQQRARRPF